MHENKQNYLIPGAILLAGLIIGGALFARGGTGAQNEKLDPTKPEVGTVKGVSAEDHLLGNPNAKVVLIEYSDLECPFCKRFHQTLKQVMEAYGKDGRVAWVYRHFPLDSLHSKARSEAHATECVAELGGPLKFWQYTDKVYEVTPSNNQLDPAVLTDTAVELGIDKVKFEECQASNRHAEKIENDYQSAVASGGQGTPWTIAVAGKNAEPISGAVPFEEITLIIDALLSK